MELILWRHAEADDSTPDLSRKLTDRGRKQAARMADWLNPRLPHDVRILTSPAARAVQTARALGRGYQEVVALAPQAQADAVLHAAGWPEASYPVLVVGHQPTLGRVAMRLLCGEAPVDAAIRKGGIWWFQSRERDGRLQVVLRSVAAPDWL